MLRSPTFASRASAEQAALLDALSHLEPERWADRLKVLLLDTTLFTGRRGMACQVALVTALARGGGAEAAPLLRCWAEWRDLPGAVRAAARGELRGKLCS